MESRLRARWPVSPVRSVVGLFEVALAIVALLALQWLVARLSLVPMVAESLHRVCYLGAAAVAAHRAMRGREDFAWRTVGVTIPLVAGGLVALVVFTDGQWLVAMVLVLAVAAGAVLATSGNLAWWTVTHTALAFLTVGLVPIFVAIDPTAALQVADGSVSLGTLASDLPRIPLYAGGVLYVIGRSLA